MEQIPQKVKLAVLQDIMAGQSNRHELAKNHNVSVSSIDRLRYKFKNRGKKTLQEMSNEGIASDGPPRKNTYRSLAPKIRELRAKGVVLREIAKKLNISNGAVTYYIYPKDRKINPPTQRESKPSHTGIPQYFVDFVMARLEHDIHEWLEELKTQLGPHENGTTPSPAPQITRTPRRIYVER